MTRMKRNAEEVAVLRWPASALPPLLVLLRIRIILIAVICVDG